MSKINRLLSFLAFAYVMGSIPVANAASCETHLTNIVRTAHLSLDRSITPLQLKNLLQRLKTLDLEIVSQPRSGRDLIVTGPDNSAWSRVSRVEGVRRVAVNVRGRELFLAWKNGRLLGRIKLGGSIEKMEDNLWVEIANPIQGQPPRDLESIRKIAEEKGFWIVTDGHRPGETALKRMEDLYGAKIIFSEDLPTDIGIVKVPGVVLHLSPDAQELNIRGDLNLGLGYGRRFAHLNKVGEYFWATAVDPTAMAPSMTAQQLFESRSASELEEMRREALSLARSFIEGQTQQVNDLRKATKKFLKATFIAAGKQYPDGLFVKWAYDWATRESDGIITEKSSVTEIVDDFISALEDSRTRLRPLSADMSGTKFLEALSASESSQAMVTYSLLARPQDILFQQKLEIAKTPDGDLAEFRVDVLFGHALSSSFRYGYDYLPDVGENARLYLQKFLDRLSDKDRYISGGFDVVLLKNGQFRIIEANRGTSSGFLNPDSYPVLANTAFSALLGRPTPVITFLEQLYALPLEKQAARLSRAPAEPRKLVSMDNISRDEILLWYRQKLSQNITNPLQGKGALDTFKALLKAAGLWDDPGSCMIYRGLKNYFKRRFE